MRTIRIGIIGILLLTLVTAGCGEDEDDDEETGLANPASVYCVEQGGTVDIRTDDTGAQTGYCVFDDSSECEEWAFYRGECTPGA